MLYRLEETFSLLFARLLELPFTCVFPINVYIHWILWYNSLTAINKLIQNTRSGSTMFLITRNINGTIEILKSSNSQSNKIFSDKNTALNFVKVLNQNTIPSMHWSVYKIDN